MNTGVRLQIEASGRTYDGEVVQTFLGREADGVVVAFDADSSPALEDGSEVAFHVTTPAFSSPIAMKGTVQQGWEEDGIRRFRLDCPATDDREPSDRRAAMRVALDKHALKAKVLGLDRSWKMVPLVNDLSATGISFLVPAGEEFSDIDSVVIVELDIPGEGVVEFGGRVCHLQKGASCDTYGVEFDVRFTQEFSRKQLLIHFFVEHRIGVMRLATA